MHKLIQEDGGRRIRVVVWLTVLIAVGATIVCYGSPNPNKNCLHGMWLFPAASGSEFYLYHKPMSTEKCHQFQVVLKASFEGVAANGSNPLKMLDTSKVFSIRPSILLPLNRFKGVGNTFTADLFLGNFEDGGTLEASQCKVKINRVLWFEPLAPGSGKAVALLFGTQDQCFLTNRIDLFPADDNQIALITASASGDKANLAVLLGNGIGKVEILAGKKKLEKNTELSLRALSGSGVGAKVKVGTVLVNSVPPDYIGDLLSQ